MSKMSVGHGTGALLVSKKDWERIPSKRRDKVKKIAREHLDKLLVTIRQKNDDSIKELQENHGVKITEIPQDEMPMYKTHGAKVADDMAGEGKLYTKETLEKVKKTLAEGRKK